MLFNSYEFIFVYFPIVAVVFFWIAKNERRWATLWLALSSLFFYGWWNPQFVLLLVGSIAFNYFMGRRISQRREVDEPNAKRWLILAIACDIFLLGYFKYTNFFIDTINALSGNQWSALEIVLPLGISFFTFTQVSFLVDAYRGIAREYNFIHYVLFVTYFPHLIAGPVLHHKQMMPQFSQAITYKHNLNNINMGLMLFTIGLFKKVVIADHFALYADPIFGNAADGGTPQLFEAWIGALSYTLQLYFDFSGYSDMAVGISRIFNISLPVNFNSPYKAVNVIDFWRRWHMTLSAFLRDYIYIPLGGNRFGLWRRYANLMVTMLIGGLWHGANWTFVAWGMLHGIYLIVNNAWQAVSLRFPILRVLMPRPMAGGFTFLSIVFAWVLFRAENFATAKKMMFAMLGFNGISLPIALKSHFLGLAFSGIDFNGLMRMTDIGITAATCSLLIGLGMIWFSPNSMQLADIVKTQATRSIYYGLMIGIAFMLAIISFKKTSPFIYFQF